MSSHEEAADCSWKDQATAYRALAETTSDVLARFDWLQRAEYCETMARRLARYADAKVGISMASPRKDRL
jgi:hypothetical protein